jgi:hypothetical protein
LQPKNIKTFKIYRYDPTSGSDKPYMASYPVNLDECGPMVLDALLKIKNELDTTLSFRRRYASGSLGDDALDSRTNRPTVSNDYFDLESVPFGHRLFVRPLRLAFMLLFFSCCVISLFLEMILS